WGGSTSAGSGSAGAAAVLSQGTTLPWPQSQKISAPTDDSGRPSVFWHLLQENQIILGAHAVDGGGQARPVQVGAQRRRQLQNELFITLMLLRRQVQPLPAIFGDGGEEPGPLAHPELVAAQAHVQERFLPAARPPLQA